MNTAYHFTADTLRDGRPLPPVGEWLEHKGAIRICELGLHFSYSAFDALTYAPGNLLHLVEVDGIVANQDDKGVCRRRRIVKTIDAEPLLRAFARWCALQVIDLWKAPPIVRQYLETGDETLRDAAWDAAWDAARDAAWAAARDAAWDAAWAAAWAAARDAAWAAARDAAWAAARDAAWDAAWDAQRRKFEEMVVEAFQ